MGSGCMLAMLEHARGLCASSADSDDDDSVDVSDAVDGAEYDVFTLLGGRNAYPRTVIVDAEGVITFAFTGSIHYEELVAEIANAQS